MTTRQATSQDAAELVSATKCVDGDGYLYHADETGEWYKITGSDLEELADLMNSDDEEIRTSAYSHWCSGCGELIGGDDEARALGLID